MRLAGWWAPWIGLGGVGLHLPSVSAIRGKGLRNPLKPVENLLQ